VLAKQLVLTTTTEELLVQANYVTSGPAALAVPRPPGYRESLFLDKDKFLNSAHRNIECIDCHDSITASPHAMYLPKVKCEKCHAYQKDRYESGMHGTAFANRDPQAPDCYRCHGTYHDMLPSTHTLSPLYHLNIPKTCASCHASSDVLKNHPNLKTDAVETYLKTVHGEALTVSGLMGAAACADCHDPHRVLTHTDPASSVSVRNIVFGCGNCHRNDQTSFTAGIHGHKLFTNAPGTSEPLVSSLTGTTAPSCISCHPGHGVTRTNTAEFQLTAVEVCGTCHKAYYKTYRDTYHGKVMRYGGTETARCDDCHGFHNLQPSSSPLSLASPARIVQTCKPCHPYSNERFVQFISHLEAGDKSHPQTYYSWLFMSILLIATMGFFVIHSLLWLIREMADLPKRKAQLAANGPTGRIQRFNLLHRLTHAILFISVIGLALTGLPLRYHTPQWAGWIFGLFGGHAAPRVLHRIFAALTILYAGMHFAYLWNLWRRSPKRPFFKTVFGPNSMIPNWPDVKQFFQHMRWMLFAGPQPKFGRWTYWEKFDYWAVFWGVAIIGASGLIMALPRFTAQLFPGWIFNVAVIVHSDEALLAASFLFAIHFFHVHLRPQRFPLDHVIFTGSITREEMEAERPLELEQLEAEGRVPALAAAEPNCTQLVVNRVIAAITLLTGLALLVGMFWTEIIARFF
jgi:cytochrome b subunit of formate dehydrogenase